jgi:hypothetical protein
MIRYSSLPFDRVFTLCLARRVFFLTILSYPYLVSLIASGLGKHRVQDRQSEGGSEMIRYSLNSDIF